MPTATKTSAPKIETLTQAQLLTAALDLMEPELVIKRNQARDFIESCAAVIEEALEDGQAVSVFGLFKVTPKYVPAKPKRRGLNPFTGDEQDFPAKPASASVRATVMKRLKDALPAPTSPGGKKLKAIAEAAQEARESRKKASEREARKSNGKGAAKKNTKKIGKRR